MPKYWRLHVDLSTSEGQQLARAFRTCRLRPKAIIREPGSPYLTRGSDICYIGREEVAEVIRYHTPGT